MYIKYYILPTRSDIRSSYPTSITILTALAAPLSILLNTLGLGTSLLAPMYRLQNSDFIGTTQSVGQQIDIGNTTEYELLTSVGQYSVTLIPSEGITIILRISIE